MAGSPEGTEAPDPTGSPPRGTLGPRGHGGGVVGLHGAPVLQGGRGVRRMDRVLLGEREGTMRHGERGEKTLRFDDPSLHTDLFGSVITSYSIHYTKLYDLYGDPHKP